MKYAIMSDVHANPVALETALADARGHGCERFVFLGDVTGYGYDAVRSLALVRENFEVALLGNHDAVCIGAYRSAEVDLNPNYDLDRAQRDALDRPDRDWLATRPDSFSEADFLCVHANFVLPRSWAYVIDGRDAQVNFKLTQQPLLFCGHTHHAALWMYAAGRCESLFEERFCRSATRPESVSFIRQKDCRYIVNVGSVGYPRNDLCATYVIYDSNASQVCYRRLPFDYFSYITKMMERGIQLPVWLLKLLDSVSKG